MVHTLLLQKSVQSSFAFSVPYMYDGIRGAGDPFYVKSCVDPGMRHLDECSGLKVCVVTDTTHHKAAQRYLPDRHIVTKDTAIAALYGGYSQGECNVFMEEGYNLSPLMVGAMLRTNDTGLLSNFTVGSSYFSNEPLTAATRTDDPQFSDFVTAILNGLVAAEARNITRETANEYPQITAFGEEYKNMMRHAVGRSGNYKEIYLQQVEGLIPRTDLNEINTGDTGLLYPHPFGFIESERDNATPLGDQLTKILERGRLRCGILVDRPGFAIRTEQGPSGMEVDFCRALSASLFRGDDTAVVFVDIQRPSDGFVLLADGVVDVVAGVTWTLENDVKEPTTGIGFSFSQPYFYGYSEEQDNLCLATRQEDSDWTNFVYWVVTASLYAEQNGLSSAEGSSSMPEVFVYGADFKRMFRDSILLVGNYAEMYERNLEPLIPRGGRNVLNSAPNNGPQHYLLPGII